ncbi:unnamed protein product [Mytilus edulis]|uniref:Reverse transcriptase domain-containing protein n=1 Tax=Mytilus edulis TaxID=6550 RepID=A0A8S3V5K2_MYTED|nr:unnamed protein product [Mytilus edulis]
MSKRTITSPSSDVVDQVQEQINQLQLQNSGLANNVWASVLLYDMEYRDRQALEKFIWGTYISNLREFHLVQKPDSATAKAIQEIQNVSRSANNANYKDQNSGFNSYNKKGKGPFLPDGRTILRLIHDASLPEVGGINYYASDTSCKYMDLKDACKIIKQGDFLAKVDLSNAYRSVKVYASNYPYTGLHWRFQGDNQDTFFYDTKLPFGAAQSPSIFQRLSSAVCRIMKSKYNFCVIAYLDDFLIIESTYDRCSAALTCLIKLLRKLGFYINWNKVEGPSQRLIFLGILIDTCKLTLSLPGDKLTEFFNLLCDFKVNFINNKPITNIQTDACNFGGGAFFNSDYFYINWKIDMPAVADFHINIKETVTLVFDNVCLYIAYLVDVKSFKYFTIVNYLNIIKHLHKANGLEEPISGNWQIQKVLNGVRRSIGDAQKGAELMTPRLLLIIKANLDLNSQNDICIWSACLMGFYGLLRPGNFLHSGKYKHRDIQICDVHYHRNGYVIELQWTKTVQFRERKLNIVLPSIVGHPFCPASAIKELLHFHFKRGAKEDAPIVQFIISDVYYTH